jgi:hypothetical protein
MCDYSLYAIPNRLVVEGEQLAVHKFPMGSLGLASAADVWHNELAGAQTPKPTLWQRLKTWFQEDLEDSNVCAVCVPPGAHLILKDIPAAMQQRYGLEEVEGVVFIQTSAEADAYRDAVRFNNGSEVRLQDLQEGQLIEVLSLAGAHSSLYEREFQMQ